MSSIYYNIATDIIGFLAPRKFLLVHNLVDSFYRLFICLAQLVYIYLFIDSCGTSLRVFGCFSFGDGITYPQRTLAEDTDRLLGGGNRWDEEELASNHDSLQN